jgi:hypothetical protein
METSHHGLSLFDCAVGVDDVCFSVQELHSSQHCTLVRAGFLDYCCERRIPPMSSEIACQYRATVAESRRSVVRSGGAPSTRAFALTRDDMLESDPEP